MPWNYFNWEWRCTCRSLALHKAVDFNNRSHVFSVPTDHTFNYFAVLIRTTKIFKEFVNCDCSKLCWFLSCPMSEWTLRVPSGMHWSWMVPAWRWLCPTIAICWETSVWTVKQCFAVECHRYRRHRSVHVCVCVSVCLSVCVCVCVCL